MNNFLSIGGGAATDDSPKTAEILEAMDDTTGWTSYAGEDTDGSGEWFEFPTRMGTEAHAGPNGGTWMWGFTGFESYHPTEDYMGHRLEKTITSVDISTINNIGFWTGMSTEWQANSNRARVYRINLYLGSDGDQSFSNSVKAEFIPTTHNFFSAQFIAFDRTDFAVEAGTFDWTALQDVRIELLGASGAGIGVAPGTATPRCYYQALQINHYYKPTVVIGHDDGPASVFTRGKAVLDSFGFKSTQYLYGDAIDAENPTNMSLAQVGQLYDEGHDICMHPHYNGDTLDTQTPAEITTQIQAGKAWLQANGWTRAMHCASYAQGIYKDENGDDAYELFVAEGVTVIRGSWVSYNHDEWATIDADDTGTTNHCMNLALRDVSAASPYDTVLRPALETLCKYGGVLILNFHHIAGSGATLTAIDLADYIAALQMIKDYETRGRLQVKTISEVFDTNGNLKIAGD